MKKILVILLFTASLLFAAGEKEFGKLLNDLSVMLDNLSTKVENAKSGSEITKALNLFSKDAKPLITQKKSLEKKYPVLFREDLELPDQVIPQAEKLAKSSERYNDAMSIKVDFMEDAAVQKALDNSEKVFEEFSNLLGSEEDEGNTDEDE